ncbi:DNA topoisomerase III (plasmid), partial [Micractinium conductrix]
MSVEALAALLAPPQRPSPPQGTAVTSSYRSREPTAFRGVTRTLGPIAVCVLRQRHKKHPKIYGFASLEAAARAFDLLTIKRALEKGRSVQGVLNAGSALGTNHPAADYANSDLLRYLASSTRDDCIYGLKQCAKKGHALQPEALLDELRTGVEAARAEAAEKLRMGDPRQSYEITAK